MAVDQGTIVWFRQDLRLSDNPALTAAVQNGRILPVYIYDDVHPGSWEMGGASQWWLHHSLNDLNKSLDGRLLVLRGDPFQVLRSVLERTGIQSVVWNRCYEPWRIARDSALKSQLESQEVAVQSFNGSLLWEPWTVLKKDETPYKVFTPYYRKGCLNRPAPRTPTSKPERIDFIDTDIEGVEISDLMLIPEIPWYEGIERQWTPGEMGAQQNLDRFLEGPLGAYKSDRDVPSRPGTSRLSPHLHFGEISPNQVWYAAQNAMGLEAFDRSLDSFLSELGWREFSYYLLFHFRDLPDQNFQDKFDTFPWIENRDALAAWQRGNTGIPIVDAGMRELWQTGYMHNRVRMIAASFLVKNLLIHWRHGAEWFWDCLVDADLASNSASWQWVAGSGADAAPYFRIFNPVTQGEKFDTDGQYVRRHCPELAAVPDKYVHRPWDAEDDLLAQTGFVLGEDYPKPIVDLKSSRTRALDAYKQIKSVQP